jgi:RNA polymerase sigma factor (TIGR02999 family)
VTSNPPTRITAALVSAARAGDAGALEELFALAYEELLRLARQVRRGRATPTLNTTALVHEAYMRLAATGSLTATDTAHFKRLMAQCMRHVLIDAARRRTAAKRGGKDVRVTFGDDLAGEKMRLTGLLELHDALRELGRLDPRRAAVVECRYFGGLDVAETALALDTSTATVKRDWRVARAWLAQRLEAGESG